MKKIKNLPGILMVIILVVSLVVSFSIIGCKEEAPAEETAEEAAPVEETAEEEAPAEETTEEEAPAEEVTITGLFLIQDEAQDTVMKEIEQKFMEKYPNIKIEAEHLDWGGFIEKLDLSISAGEAPDVGRIPFPVVGRYEAMDSLLDITPYISSDFESHFFPERFMSVKYGDSIVGCPIDSDFEVFFVNLDYFEQAGIQLPDPKVAEDAWTWAELQENSQKIIDSTDAEYSWACMPTGTDVLSFIWSNNGSMLTEDLSTANISSEKSVEVINELIKQEDIGYFPTGIWGGQDQPEVLFRGGIIAMFEASSYFVTGFTDDSPDFNWAVMCTPYFDHPETKFGGCDMVAFNQSKNPEAAAKWAEFQGDLEILNMWSEATSYLTTRVDAQPDYGDYTKLLDVIEISRFAGASKQQMAELLHPGYLEFIGIVAEELLNGVLEVKTPEEAVEAASVAINDYLNK